MQKILKLLGGAMVVITLLGLGWLAVKVELRRQHLVRVCQPGETTGPRSGLFYGVYTHRVEGLDKKSLSTVAGRKRGLDICRREGFNPR